MNQNFFLGLAVAAAMTAGAANAQNCILNFGVWLSGSPANDQPPSGLSFRHGNLIRSAERRQIDLAVPVMNPKVYSRGNAPDSVLDPTLVWFSSPQDLNSFSLTLDNDTFGPGLSLERYASGLTTDTMFATVPNDQLAPGFVASIGDISGVDKIVLPGDALSDNLGFVVVPGSAAGAVAGLGLLVLAWRPQRMV